jgi:hypothetical protein
LSASRSEFLYAGDEVAGTHECVTPGAVDGNENKTPNALVRLKAQPSAFFTTYNAASTGDATTGMWRPV